MLASHYHPQDARYFTKHELRDKIPVLRNIVHLTSPLRHRGDCLIVLQVRAKSLSLQRGPQHELVNSGSMLAPLRKDVVISLELVLVFRDGGIIFVKADLRKRMTRC